ncbi:MULTISPECIES: transporter substrate-binding domain-containing protein [Roseobacter]|uniref:Bacterial extracellular solute binding protein, family 3 n=1 Tax=Roseobacter litoralis (strain ATCC 49566 / DSM 6996 / JCM 21268 / NBRC 15278 / OCh 149) TaxID=391595 RepID=F7ZAS6_ROSLO|nr:MULTISPECIES: transporter substrate-binding domain-containing protein [Roseobacter]AEI94272.1 putative bacterial extracellular solute binding protein, family 3 [Roseobacter litoralis Och 149]GIT87286.1 amino acid ABC transporter substrate-binding protein [Roseobacter sp. OBYS 0001]
MKRRTVLAAAIAATVMGAGTVAQAQDSTMAQVRDNGVLRVGVTQAPPWYSKDIISGEWTGGLGVSMGKAMAETLGVEFEPVEVTWGTAVAALQADRIDLMFVLDATDARKEAVNFPETPLLYYSLAVLARDDLEITDWADLNSSDISVSVPQATSMDAFLTENAPNADIQRFPGNAEAIAAFQAGRVDAVTLFHPPLIAARQKLGSGQIIVPQPVESRPSSVAVRQETDPAFVNWVNEQIDGYYKSGQTQVWYEEFLSDFGLDPSKVPAIIRERL